MRDALVVLALIGSTTVARAVPPPRIEPGHIVVRYGPQVSGCVDCRLRQHLPFAPATGSASLDALHDALGVRGARALFAGAPGASAVGAGTPRDRLSGARQRFATRAARAPQGVSLPDLERTYVLDIDAADPVQAAALYARDPAVMWAEPQYVYTITNVPDDPFFASSGTWGQSYADLWGLHLLDAPTAWDVSTGNGATVAVVDTGIDATHPDVAANLWVNPGEVPGNGIDDDNNGFVDDVRGWDFSADNANPTDGFGHGTHVAGTIAAVGNNGLGVVGLAWGARLMDVRVFDASANATSTAIAEGIVYAAENGADVINASFGGGGSQAIRDAVATAVGLGVVFVAAAGNDAHDVDAFEPAALPGVIAVAASDPSDAPAYFSNFGDAVSVAAPGVDVLSLRAAGTSLGPVVATDYVRLSGTSMATPHVAGAAALLLAADPSLDIEQVRWHLELNADQPGVPGYEGERWNPHLGYGRVNASRVFDPPPVTARIRPRRFTRHAYAGTAGPLAAMQLSFTTLDPVTWSLLAPPWVSPSVASGTGAAALDLAFDATGLAAGASAVGDVTADAAGLDWSEALAATLHVHRDIRLGAEIAVHPDDNIYPSVSASIQSASNGSGAYVVFYDLSNNGITYPGLRGGVFGADGSFAAPALIAAPYASDQDFDVASDGANFFVVWVESSPVIDHGKQERRVMGRRIASDGSWLDLSPIVINSRTYRVPYDFPLLPFVGFDGSDYYVVWQRRKVNTPGSKPYRTWVKLRRVAPNGILSAHTKRISTRRGAGDPGDGGVTDARFACRPGSCLFTYRRAQARYNIPIIGEQPQNRGIVTVPITLASSFRAHSLAAGGPGYLLSGIKNLSCTGIPFTVTFSPAACQWDIVAVRLGPNGESTDSEPIRLNRGEPGFSELEPFSNSTFDGTNWLVTFMRPRPLDAGRPYGGPVFLARLAPDGTVLDDEDEGLLAPVDTAFGVTVTRTSASPVIAWRDGRDSGVTFHSVYAQAVTP